MKRERILQIFLAVLGLLFLALLYPPYTDLWHAKWLLEMHNETDPMFFECLHRTRPLSAACRQEALGTSLADRLHGLVEFGARRRHDD